jgi:transcriptional regulator with GAF, ATPase, and Fis domain
MKRKDIEKRRRELWIIAILVIAVYSTSVIALSYFQESKSTFLIFLGIFSFLFCSYVVDKERRLMELNRQLRIEELQTLEQEVTISLLNTKLKEISTLHKAVEAVSLEREPHKALDKLLKSVLELFKISRSSIMLIDEKGETLIVAASSGLEEKFFKPQKIGEGVAGWVAKTGEPIILPGKVKGGRFVNFIDKEADIFSSLCVPLSLGVKVIGVLNCSSLSHERHAFTEYDLELLSVFAHYASVALENAQLRSKLKKDPHHQ